MTTVQQIERSGNKIKVVGLDALNGSPILDIKLSVQLPDAPSNGNTSPNDLLVILGIVGIVGAVRLGASIAGLFVVRRRRSEVDQN